MNHTCGLFRCLWNMQKFSEGVHNFQLVCNFIQNLHVFTKSLLYVTLVRSDLSFECLNRTHLNLWEELEIGLGKWGKIKEEIGMWQLEPTTTTRMLVLEKNRMPQDKNLYLARENLTRDRGGRRRNKCRHNCGAKQDWTPNHKDVYLSDAGY